MKKQIKLLTILGSAAIIGGVSTLTVLTTSCNEGTGVHVKVGATVTTVNLAGIVNNWSKFSYPIDTGHRHEAYFIDLEGDIDICAVYLNHGQDREWNIGVVDDSTATHVEQWVATILQDTGIQWTTTFSDTNGISWNSDTKIMTLTTPSKVLYVNKCKNTPLNYLTFNN